MKTIYWSERFSFNRLHNTYLHTNIGDAMQTFISFLHFVLLRGGSSADVFGSDSKKWFSITMHCPGTSTLSVDKGSRRKRQIPGQILRWSKPRVKELHKVLCQSTLFLSPGKKYGLISSVRKCSRLWLVEERSTNQSYHFVSCPRYKLYAEHIRRNGAAHHCQYAFHGSAEQPKIATNATQPFHSYFAALLEITKLMKLLSVFCK